MSARITKAFERFKSEKRTALVTFTMACDPDYDTSLKILNGLPEAGADIVELGIPFSDPMADGPVIEAAGNRALAAGANLHKALKIAASFRKKHPAVPLILMGYYNPILQYGLQDFAQDAVTAGVDGVIIVDLPPEEEAGLAAVKKELSIIRLIAPTSGPERLPELLKSASGFVYYIAVTGITGGKSANMDTLKQRVDVLRQQTSLPIAVGFGVKTAAQVKEIGQLADAVVVGSALVDTIAKAEDKVAAALDFVKKLRSGAH